MLEVLKRFEVKPDESNLSDFYQLTREESGSFILPFQAFIKLMQLAIRLKSEKVYNIISFIVNNGNLMNPNMLEDHRMALKDTKNLIVRLEKDIFRITGIVTEYLEVQYYGFEVRFRYYGFQYSKLLAIRD
jgi:hypothetical protein